MADLGSDYWLDDKHTLMVHEKELLETRLDAYAKNPNAGSTWEEVEGRVQARLTRRRPDEPSSK
jgi:hypothetical protein